MSQAKPRSQSNGPKRKRRARAGPGGSTEARRTVGVILEVLAGLRTPIDAASVLSVSPNRYYQLEDRALEGMVVACEPRPRGRQLTANREIAELKKQVKALESDVHRYQALARATQRTVGIAPPTKTAASGKKRRKRKPVLRALKLMERLQCPPDAAPPEEGADAQ